TRRGAANQGAAAGRTRKPILEDWHIGLLTLVREVRMFPSSLLAVVVAVSLLTLGITAVEGQRQPAPEPDAVQEAQPPGRGTAAPPSPDPKDPLAARNARPSSPAFADQPDKGKIEGFDFFRDPLNAKRPM